MKGSRHLRPHKVRAERDVLGLTLAPLSQDLIDKFNIEKRLNGVVVTQVDANSELPDEVFMSGDVVLQTNQDVVSTPDDMVRSVESATKDGQKTILLLLSNARGKAVCLVVAWVSLEPRIEWRGGTDFGWYAVGGAQRRGADHHDRWRVRVSFFGQNCTQGLVAGSRCGGRARARA